MKLKTKTYKSILSISILTSLGIGTMMTNSYEDIETNTSSSHPLEQIIIGGNHSSLIDSTGDLWMWGDNGNGKLGDGSDQDRPIPINISDQENDPFDEAQITQVVVGDQHSAAIDENGDLWMWGDNKYGQLGNGTNGPPSYTPINISQQINNPLGETRIEQVSLGHLHSAAIDEDGNLWMWGWNSRSQLGDGSTTNSSTPINISILDDENEIYGQTITQVALGYDYSGAIDSTGDLWMWGDNGNGQLGDGTNEKSSTPINITDKHGSSLAAKTIDQVVLGEYHSAAIDEDGDLWVWGANEYGQLGNGSTTSSSTPINISDDQNLDQFEGKTIEQVALGRYHSAAIDEDDNLWMWGRNNNGQLTNEIEGTHSSTPINITAQFDNKKIEQVTLGSGHSGAIDSNGDLWMWGNNYYGQLGNGDFGKDGDREDQVYSPEPINITDQFIFIYDTYVEDVTSSTATLNYSLMLGDYVNGDNIVQYNSGGTHWVQGPSATEEPSTIELTGLDPETTYNFWIQVIDSNTGTLIAGPTSFKEFTTTNDNLSILEVTGIVIITFSVFIWIGLAIRFSGFYIFKKNLNRKFNL